MEISDTPTAEGADTFTPDSHDIVFENVGFAYDNEQVLKGVNFTAKEIGITVVEDGRITEEFYSLVDPETYFDYFNVKLTGIDERVVANAPNFPKLWLQIEPLMPSGLLVAHNAVFDMNVLKRCLRG